MQRTIFALWGISNLGKTTTIRLVFNELRKEGRLIYAGPRSRTEVKGAILEIDGVKIGFASPGDTPSILEEYLEELIGAGCTIIICATHTRGGTVDGARRIGAQADPPYKLVWIEKACPQVDHADGNRKKADEIISAVRAVLASAELVEV